MKETDVHRSLCKWIRLQYPYLPFLSDFYTFLSQSNRFGLESMRKRNMPDIFIAYPVGKYKGLFIEIKTESTKIFKKDGSFSSEHIQEQAEMLEKLNNLGYKAVFGIGLEHCTEIVNQYINNS